jgi:GNAT superfamily N-acetyltransferase
MRVRIFEEEKDSKQVLALISDIIVNEFHFKLELEEGGLDSDLIHIEEHYKKSGGCFWVAEEESSNIVVGTTGVRKLTQSICELKRMYVSKAFRRSGIAQKMLDAAIEFARAAGYSRMVLDSSKSLTGARSLYLKNSFVDTERYNDNYRADVFMQRQL